MSNIITVHELWCKRCDCHTNFGRLAALVIVGVCDSYGSRVLSMLKVLVVDKWLRFLGGLLPN